MGNNEIITLARQLGEALKNCEEYKAFCETRDDMRKNVVLKEQLDEFKVQKSVLEVEKEKGEPDEHVVDVLSARLEGALQADHRKSADEGILQSRRRPKSANECCQHDHFLLHRRGGIHVGRRGRRRRRGRLHTQLLDLPRLSLKAARI